MRRSTISRPTSITLVAAILMTVGTISLLLVILVLAAPLLQSGSPFGASISTPGIFGTNSRRLVLTGGGLWGIVTGVGLLRLREWARISIVVWAGILVFLGAVFIEVLLFIPIPALTNVSAQGQATLYHFTTTFFLFLLAVGGWWFCLFNTSSIRDFFQRNAQGTGRAPLPLSISLVGWFLVLSGCLTFVLALMRQPATFFNLKLGRWGALLIYLAMSVAELYLGIGLLKAKTLSRIIAVYFFLFGLLDSVFFLLHPERAASAAVGIGPIPLIIRPPTGGVPVFLGWLPLIIAVVGTLIPVWFLITRKQRYLASSETAQ
jgi:hypothetical protein